MSTSDNDSQKMWQPWRPTNLLESEDVSLPTIRASVDGEGSMSEAKQQAELSRLYKQAEENGFAKGKALGYEDGKKEGYDAGVKQGLEEGRETGKTEMNAQQEEVTARLKTLLQNMQGALDSLDSVVPSRLAQLALSAARTLLGKNVVSDSTNEMLQKRIQHLLHDEPLFKEQTQMWVSPEDKSFIAQQFGETLAARGWTLNGDENMLPGGCRITSDEGEIDESLETRWKMLCTLMREEHQE